MTYGELRSGCKRFAGSLLKTGLKSGKDVVTLILPNMPEYPIAALGSIEAGLIISPVNPIYTADEIAQQIIDSNSSCVIAHYNQLDNAQAALFKAKLKGQVICVDDYDGQTKSLPSGVIRFSEMLNNNSTTATEQLSAIDATILTDNIVTLPYSSGTTGLPKGVCLSHYNITSNLYQFTHDQIEGIIETTESHQDTVPAILPFFHIYGSIVMLRAFYNGAKIVTLPKFDPKYFLNILRSNKEIFLHVVPPILQYLAVHPDVSVKDLDQVRCTMSGGAPCSAEDIDRLITKKKHKVFQGYGLTESSPILTHPLATDHVPSSAGSPVVNTLGKAIDWKTGKTLPLGTVGELCFKGPQIMVGYHKKAEATAKTVDTDGWLHTGDIGYFDNSGMCYILDRIKELIKVKGFQVAPAELEGILRQHPGINDVGITSIPCEKSGERPIAFVVLKSTTNKATLPNEEHIMSYLATKVAPYKQLARVIFVETIPKTASGKILRRKLKELVKTEL